MGAKASGLRFAISRSNGGPSLLEGARRFASVLGVHLKMNVAIAVSYDYAALLKTLLTGGAELAWMPPLMHARAVAAGGQLVAVSQRGGRLGYRSALVVRQDSRFKTLADLVAVRAAWVDTVSSSGYIFPRLHLLAAGVDPQEAFTSERFFGSATNACRAVINREADLAACFLSTADDRTSAQRELEQTFQPIAALRVLDVTGRIPPDGFVTAPGLEPSLHQTVAATLLGLHLHSDGKGALQTLLQAEQLAPAPEHVMRDLQRLLAHAAE